MEWLELGGTLKINWFRQPCHGLGHSPLEQIAQKPVPVIRHAQLLCFLWFGFDIEGCYQVLNHNKKVEGTNS